jgi:hypothetical protein
MLTGDTDRLRATESLWMRGSRDLIALFPALFVCCKIAAKSTLGLNDRCEVSD